MTTQHINAAPCAQVPVHPRTGRLWANVRPAGAETPVPRYELVDLYDKAALDAAVAAERERWRRIAAAAKAVTDGAEDIGDFIVSSSLMASLASALDVGPNVKLSGCEAVRSNAG